MSSRLRIAASLALVLGVAGCVVPTGEAPQRETTVRSGLAPRVLKMQSGTLSGQVIAPGVIANGGGNVIAAGGGNVIAAGGGNVIANGGGNVIANGGGNYRALAAAESVPVSGAVVILRDAVTRKRIDWSTPVTTDASGHFTFEKLPTKINFLVEVVFVAPDQQPYRLMNLGTAHRDDVPTTVSWTSTAVTSAMLADVSESSTLYVMEPEQVAAVQSKLAAAVAAVDDSERPALIKRCIAASGRGSITVDDVLPVAAVASASETTHDLAEHDAELGAAMSAMFESMNMAPTADKAELVKAAVSLGRSVSPPEIDGEEVVVPGRADTSSPTPAPTATPFSWATEQLHVTPSYLSASDLTATDKGVAFLDKATGILYNTPLEAGAGMTSRSLDALGGAGIAWYGDALVTYNVDKGQWLDPEAHDQVLPAPPETPKRLFGTPSGLLAFGDTKLTRLVTRQAPETVLTFSDAVLCAVDPDGTTVLLTAKAAPAKVKAIPMPGLATASRTSSTTTLAFPDAVTALATDGEHVAALVGNDVYACDLDGTPERVASIKGATDVAIARAGVVVAAQGDLFVLTPEW